MAEPAVSREEVARGAGLAGLARGGALIEAVAQPLYVWMFGLAGYGIYVALWAAISLLTNLLDLSMTSALQRVVPTQDSEEKVHGAVRLAILTTVIPAILVAAVISLFAEEVSRIFSAAPEDAARLPTAIALFAWALPLWTFVEVATSAARARRAFGPEIRLRIFWEQAARLLFAATFFAFGFQSLGLMAAHLCSLILVALLSLRLLSRYFDLGMLRRAPIGRAVAADLMLSGLALLPANLSRRLLIDAPPLILNLVIPGARGASAAAIFEIARKLSTVPHIVRQAFQYVLAPLSSAQAHADRRAIEPLYRFASRVSTALVVPLSGLIVFAGVDILSVYRSEAMAALPLLAILCAARAVEAMAGPAAILIEMTGHRALPLLNSALAILLWILLGLWLTPSLGALGMAVAVSAAIILSTWAASVELRLAEGLSPFDRYWARALAIALAGTALMGLVPIVTGGPPRFLLLLLSWAATSWTALRFGLEDEDRRALGGIARRLRLAPKAVRP